MTDRDRQRRLSVQNRLEELRAKYGTDLESETLPAWLDSYEGWRTEVEPKQAAHVNGARKPQPDYGLDIPSL